MQKDTFRDTIDTYPDISGLLKEYSYEELLHQVSEVLAISQAELEKLPMGGYSKGKLSGTYKDALLDLIKNIDYYDWVYENLADDISRQAYTHLIQYRILPDMHYIDQAFDGDNDQYFDESIISCDKDEVFVDCGGFIGDTAENFIRHYKDYKKIYVYEPSGDSLHTCIKKLGKYPGVSVRGCGVGEKNADGFIQGSGASGSFAVKIVSLDEDIQEKVTFIKMDVEGFEVPAIIGAKRHIRNDAPKLAICIYNSISAIWEIPKLISYMNPNYRFFIRHYMRTKNRETVLYAIPPKKQEVSGNAVSSGKKRVVAMAPYERGWSNVELVKDCGLIPYLLYKNHHCEVAMVGAETDSYPYLELISGVKLEFLEDGSEQMKLDYMRERAGSIDCLILRGCYPSNFNVAKLYKQLRPDGKIYVGLDANSQWMDTILWDDKEFMGFMDCCDVLATSCEAMQEHLNIKWPWRIEHIPNGYYDLCNVHKVPDFEEKEDIILTVGRIGSEQKATHILLSAFAMIAEQIPGWKLRLIGNLDPGFQEYLDEFATCFPQLADRVQFVGPISDRSELFHEYLKAKIFAMTSWCEGGTPNVIAEALNAGCAIATTKIDAYKEIIGNEDCGLAAEVNNYIQFAEILLKLCNDGSLRQKCANAYSHGREHFDMEKIVAKLDKLLFGGKTDGDNNH